MNYGCPNDINDRISTPGRLPITSTVVVECLTSDVVVDTLVVGLVVVVVLIVVVVVVVLVVVVVVVVVVLVVVVAVVVLVVVVGIVAVTGSRSSSGIGLVSGVHLAPLLSSSFVASVGPACTPISGTEWSYNARVIG